MKNRIGIIGGGQLGRMLTLEAKKLGFHVTVIDPTPQGPAAQVADDQIIAAYSDPEATKKLITQCDFVTLEVEHIDTKTLKDLKTSKMNPSAATVELIKDKYAQKVFLKKHFIATPEFEEIKEEKDIEIIAKKFGYPLVLKAKHDAFDGRGNAIIKTKKDIHNAYEILKSHELYAEKFVDFHKELSVIIARGESGELKTYPVVETIQKNNICHMVIAPAQIDLKIIQKAEKNAKKVMKYLMGTGVFAIEMFLDNKNNILINEIAPRVHNSGHFSIEACITSQFEQHIRAVTHLPLGSTDMIHPAAVMINILGDRKGPVEVKGLEKVLKIPNVHVHIYGKAETKPERKMGHITVTGEKMNDVLRLAKRVRKMISI
ncbi:MAG TPA: 5-(carboxyamino)imidazole ribonucleotide synthase [Candidatus Nitrosocosmicus sp.]|nr:5-(carboxyamino)imidazole ribonucleotide synthase [Candidatus Nitrosocosmicus sp.]